MICNGGTGSTIRLVSSNSLIVPMIGSYAEPPCVACYEMKGRRFYLPTLRSAVMMRGGTPLVISSSPTSSRNLQVRVWKRAVRVISSHSRGVDEVARSYEHGAVRIISSHFDAFDAQLSIKFCRGAWRAYLQMKK